MIGEDDIEGQLAASVRLGPQGSSDMLARITQLAQTMRAAKARLDAAAEELSEAKAEYQRIEREDLPNLMAELDLENIRLKDGTVIEVLDDLDCAITEERRAAAHAWLAENGYSGIIKSNISIDFDRNELEEAYQLARQISELTGEPIELNEKIHPQTLKAFIKERMKAGTPVPFDLFGVRPFARAKLTTKKR